MSLVFLKAQLTEIQWGNSMAQVEEGNYGDSWISRNTVFSSSYIRWRFLFDRMFTAWMLLLRRNEQAIKLSLRPRARNVPQSQQSPQVQVQLV